MDGGLESLATPKIRRVDEELNDKTNRPEHAKSDTDPVA